MDIIDELRYRDMINDFSDIDKIKDILSAPTTLYCGFDPSAKSMHLGNFVMVTTLRRLQEAGHKIIAVVGGGTGMIGDPSGKNSERNFLGEEAIKANVISIENQLRKYLDFSSPDKGILINNYDWLSKISILEFLRDYGKFFQVNYMLSKDIISSRLADGISYTEFSYMVLQSADFMILNQKYNCKIQIGGGDQWGNLTAGLELMRKVYGSDKSAEAMSVKLLLNSEGKKFGKSEKGALYLDPTMTSPYEIYQYFINSNDTDSIKYLKVFSNFNENEIKEIEALHQKSPELRYAQKTLAHAILVIVHGEEAAKECEKMAEALYLDSLKNLQENSINTLIEGLETFEVITSISLIDALISLNLASSKREAREFIKNGSIKINGDKELEECELTKENALFNRVIVIKRGKKNFGVVIFK